MTIAQGFDAAALANLKRHVEADVARGLYDGAVIKVGRHGAVAFDEVVGFAARDAGQMLAQDSVFHAYSLSKAFTNVLVLRAIDLGLLALTTPVIEVIPEFLGRDLFRAARKPQINLGHLLTHRAGLSPTPKPVDYADLHDLDKVIAAICDLDAIGEPGQAFNYSPCLNHALMGEICRRVYGEADFAALAKREIFDPLGMKDTSFGLQQHIGSRLVPAKSEMPAANWLKDEDILCVADAVARAGSAMPWVGAVTTTADVYAFAEMLRQGGSIDGHRILSPAIIAKASTLQTGDMINDLYRHLAEPRGWETPPGNMGLGFALGGAGLKISQFGTLSGPRNFGNFGAGSTLFWVDPDRDISFVCLTTKIMEESENIARFQRLSDLVISAAL